jgi:hypothetical protein
MTRLDSESLPEDETCGYKQAQREASVRKEGSAAVTQILRMVNQLSLQCQSVPVRI